MTSHHPVRPRDAIDDALDRGELRRDELGQGEIPTTGESRDRVFDHCRYRTSGTGRSPLVGPMPTPS